MGASGAARTRVRCRRTAAALQTRCHPRSAASTARSSTCAPPARQRPLPHSAAAPRVAVRACAQSIRPFGVFVELEGRRRHGLVHVSQVAAEVSFAREDEDADKVKALEFYAPVGSQARARPGAGAPGACCSRFLSVVRTCAEPPPGRNKERVGHSWCWCWSCVFTRPPS
jgi:hypothetical protein